MAFIQPFMRRSCNDVFAGMLSFRYGTSPLNQVYIYIYTGYEHGQKKCCTIIFIGMLYAVCILPNRELKLGGANSEGGVFSGGWTSFK